MVRNLMIILGLSLSLAAFGCSSDDGGGNGGNGGDGGAGGGEGGSGGSGPIACTDDADCEDNNECTTDMCGDDDFCDNTPVEDLTDCTSVADGKCFAGECTGGITTGACVNAADVGALAGGNEPPEDTSMACGLLAFGMPVLCDNDGAGYNQCLLSGASDTATPTTLSADCSLCYAGLSCCGLSACGPAGTGDCLGAPQPGDDCDICTADNCGAAFTQCSGLPYGIAR